MNQPGENIPAVYRHTSMEVLSDQLFRNSETEILQGSIFQPFTIIVPNKNTARYLTIRFAQKYGIAAGMEFPFLMSLFQRQNFVRADGMEEHETWYTELDAGTISWRIFQLLPSLLEEPDFALLKNWLHDNDPLRLYTLAHQLGNLYDKYMLYRPQWINIWEQNCIPEELRNIPEAEWQRKLWLAVAGNDWKGHHFPALIQQILDGTLIPKYKDTIRIFGFSSVAPVLLECISMLSAYQNVELYHFVSSREFYGSSKLPKEELKEFVHLYCNQEESPEKLQTLQEYYYFQHNPLVASFAAQGRVLLNETISWNERETFEPEITRKPTLLHRLQDRIIHDMSDTLKEEIIEGEPDRSIQVRSCYSEFREVETARNFILHCFEETPDLNLNDILIMSPDPDKFSSIADAVFNHSATTPGLRVSIGDLSVLKTEPSYRTFLKILQLYKGDFTSSEIFSILQDHQIQQYLGLSSADCKYCLERTNAAGIRWGWNAEEHKNAGGVAFPQTSWLAGLDRLLFNYAVDSDPMDPVQLGGEQIFSVPGFSGGQGELLGIFTEFATHLHSTAQKMRNNRFTGMKFANWKAFLHETAESFFGPDSSILIPLAKYLKDWETEMQFSGTPETILNSDIIVKHLEGLTEEPEDSSKGFLRGCITFCGLRPMRCIPARVIILLGMNHDAFPSSEPRYEFNLLRKSPYEGDPCLRDDERQLFLDLLLSARDYLYFSYVGRNNHDRKKYPPSVCVEELRNYLEITFGKTSFVNLEEPLQTFSADLFKEGMPDQSYSKSMLEAAKRISLQKGNELRPLFATGTVSAEPDEAFYKISLSDLQRFFQNPARRFISERLKASTEIQDEIYPLDCEPFENEYLDFNLKEELLEKCLHTPTEEYAGIRENFMQCLKSDALLPVYVRENWKEGDSIFNLAKRVPAEFTEILPLCEKQIPVKDGKIFTLAIPDLKLYKNIQYVPCFIDQPDGATLINPVLMHLAANLSASVETRIVTQNSIYIAEGISVAEAEQKFSQLLSLYQQGMTEPLLFFPKTSYAALSSLKDMEKAWYGNPGGDKKGEYAKYEDFFGKELPDPEIIKEYANQFFGTVEFVNGGKVKHED